MCGNRVRVELSHGRPRGRGPPMGSRYSTTWEERHGRGGGGDGGGRGGGGGYNDNDRYYDR